MPRQRKKKRRRRAKPHLLQRLTHWPTLLAIVVVGAVAAVVAAIVLGVVTQGSNSIERIQEISAEGRTRGSATAPVTIIEFADFQCSHCKRFAETTGNQIEEEYVATNQVRVEFRHMPLIGAGSVLAAEAAQCANDQGQFWEYHDELFERQGPVNSGAYSQERLKRFAGELGLDQEVFNSCLDSSQYEQFVIDEAEAGQDAGVTSTPWFFIGDEVVQGNLSIGEFRRVIDDQLVKATSPP